MTQRGYKGTSMEAIAAEAGVGKPTLYLRYKSKEELLTAALGLLHMADAPALTGDLREDLIIQLREMRVWYTRLSGMPMVGLLLAEEGERPELLAEFRRLVVRPRRAQIRTAFDAAIERGELPADAAVDGAVEMLVGAYYAHYLAHGSRFPRNWPEAEVDLLLAGLRPAAKDTGRKRRKSA